MTVPVYTTLTTREAQIVRRLVEGSTTREIAESYGIAHQTVKNYVTVIYEKLGVRRREQLRQAVTGVAPTENAKDVGSGLPTKAGDWTGVESRG